MSKTYYPVYKSSSGDVGVGTTSPTLQSNYRFLQVNGSVSAVIETTVGGTRIGGFDSTSSVLYVGTIGSYPVVFRTAVDEKMRISANGNIGIGTSSPAYKLDVNTANDSAIRIRNGGGGANNGLAFSVGSGSPWLDITEGVEFRIKGNTYANIGTWNSGNNTKLLIDSNGNIGIGTTSPAAKLHVYARGNGAGILIESDPTDNANQAPALKLYPKSANVNERNWSISPFRDTPQSLSISSSDSKGGDPYANATTRLIIDGISGNVGIGTTSPTSKLHIYDSEYSFIRCTNTANAGHYVDIGANSAGQSFLFSYGAYPVLIGTNGGERVRIDTSGNVGIGTTSPGYKLEMTGTSTAIRVLSTTGDAYIRLTDNGVRNWDLKVVDVSDYFEVGGTSATSLVVTGAGNVGIGTTGPATKLEVYGVVRVSESSSGGILQLTAGASAIDIASTFYGGSRRPITFTMDSEKMRITSDGNVGIGTSTVRSTLHVNGDIIRDTNVPYSWGTSAPFRTFAGAYSYANSGVNGVARYLLLWPQITNVNGQNGRFVNARLIVSRGATHAFNDTTIGDVVASAGYNSSANVYAYTPIVGEKLYFYNIVYNSVTYLAISLPISDYRWELTGHYGIEETAYYSPTFVYANTSGVGTVTQLTDYTNESVAIYNKGGNIGINTTNPGYKLDVNGSINTSTFMYVSYPYGDAFPLQLVGSSFLKANNNYYGLLMRSGDVNYISGRLNLYGGSSKRLELLGYEESVGYLPVVIPGGNVGIGTTSPAYTLQVGTGANSATARAAFLGGYTVFENSAGTGNPSITFNNDTDTGILNPASNTIVFTTNGTEKIRINSDGNLGIGTTSPSHKLDVAGSASFTNIVYAAKGILSDSSGVNPVLEVYNTVATNATTAIIRQTTAGGNGNQDIGLLVDIQGAGDSDRIANFRYYNGSTYTSRMAILRSGNVGIGTSSPIAMVHVESSNSQGDNKGLIYLKSTSGTNVLKIGVDGTNNFTELRAYTPGVGDNSKLILQPYGGSVGIGTTSPTTKFEVVEGEIKAGRVNSASEGGQVSFGRSSDNTTVWYIDLYGSGSVPDFRVVDGTIGSVRLNINSDGNVGIGSTSPSQKLDVNGTVKATSYLGDFKGRLVRTSTTQTITGNVALTIDVSAAYIHIITVQASGGTFGITGITYNNRKTEPEVDEIILIFKWPATGSGVINVSNIIGDTPAFNYGKATAVRLTSYKGTGGLWICEQIASNMDYTNL